MKSLISYLSLAVLLPLHSASQDLITKFFSNSETPVAWLGLDFSEFKYMGDPGTVSYLEMKSLLNEINYLIIRESEKYSISETFTKTHVSNDIQCTLERNDAINAEDMVSMSFDDDKRFNAAHIQDMVKAYNFNPELKGAGLVFICEVINKNTEEAFWWVALLDVESKEVLFTERLSGEGYGFGFRNHWCGSVKSVLDKVEGEYYKQWKKKFIGTKK